jgi:Transposase
MTGPKIITMWRCRTKEAGGWLGPGCPRAWPESPDYTAPGQVLVGIETDPGPWVSARVAAGYQVFAINPRQVARYRERHGTCGAKSDAGDAHTLADMVRTDAYQLRPVAGTARWPRGSR